jgi:hypothetical protein
MHYYLQMSTSCSGVDLHQPSQVSLQASVSRLYWKGQMQLLQKLFMLFKDALLSAHSLNLTPVRNEPVKALYI